QQHSEPHLTAPHSRHSLPQHAAPVSSHPVADSHSVWSRFVVFINEQRPAIGSILEHGSPLKLENGLMEIGFPAGSYYLTSAQDAGFVAEVEPLACQFTGINTLIRVKSISPDSVDAPISMSEKKKCDYEKHMEELRLEVQKHPVVIEAQRIFGVSVTDVKEF
ncbi:MAG: DNA polymerase III subunit gamma/tau, partial [Deltaproteobacteria bacterium]|nr:DNA polymerase III subunit gamma/tau [Deltaproteobacteria bacterium]